jgi:hypothetical protein
MIYKINKNVLIEESLLNHIRDNKNAYAVGRQVLCREGCWSDGLECSSRIYSNLR